MTSQNQPAYEQHLHKTISDEKFTAFKEKPVQESQLGMPSGLQKSNETNLIGTNEQKEAKQQFQSNEPKTEGQSQ